MYLSHFGLTQLPFGITPNPAFFFTGSTRGAILEAMIYAVCHGEGIIKVTGEVGSGKTMLCRMLESSLPSNVVVIYLVNPTLSREEVVYTIAGELSLDTAGKRPDEVIRLLQADLIAKHTEGKQVVLLVEEAQAMPLETLEEIRLFSNLETAHHKLLQIVMFGQPELDENLALPHMRQLKERITHSFKVPPMPDDVIPEFLMFRLRAAGYHGPDIFTPAAIALIAQVSEGIVRRINILADKTLLAAFADGTHTIRAKHVKSAIADSEFSSAVIHWWDARKALALSVFSALCLLLSIGIVLWTSQRTVSPALPSPSLAPATAAPVTVTPVTVAPATVAPPTLAAPQLAHSVPVANAQSSSPAMSSKSAPSAQPAALRPSPATQTQAAHPSPSQRRLAVSKAWLASQSAATYTIQLGEAPLTNSANTDRLLQKMAAENNPDHCYVFPSRKDGNPHVALVCGSYETRDAALTMRLRLEKEWGQVIKLRTIRGIRDEIATSAAGDLWPK